MVNDNYNMIKPVESLQNISGVTPAKRRQERKRRQNLHTEHKEEPEKEESEQKLNESLDQQSLGDELADGENGQGTGQRSIDYCA